MSLFSDFMFSTVAFLTMLAGAQTVHVIYQPLSDLDEYVQKEIERRKKEEAKAN